MARVNVGTLPAAVDLTLYQGDDFYLDVTVTDSEGFPFDLSVYTPKSQIRISAPSTEVLAELECAVTGNLISLHLDSAQSAKLTMRLSVWDVQITDGAGAVITLAYGNVYTTPQVTR